MTIRSIIAATAAAVSVTIGALAAIGVALA